MTGLDAAPRSSAALSTPSSSGAERTYPAGDGAISTSPSSSSALAENATNVGPVGGVFASLKARRITNGTWSGWVTSAVHLVNGRTISARSVRPWASSRMSLLPALSTSGVPPAYALCNRLMPLASPVSMWRFTNAGRPVARA